MRGLLEGLNQAQQRAVTAPLGHQLILAGAGSGKTRVLVNRIAWLIEQAHLSAHGILAVTFTNKAAGEMKARLAKLLDRPVQNLWVGTFHGLCHRLLRRHAQEAKLPEQFQILDSDDQIRLLKRVINALNLDLEQWPAKQAQHFINHKKDEGLRSHHLQFSSYGPEKTLVKIYEAYEQACQTAGVIDFAEILLRCHELLRDNETLLSHYQQRFQAILVDEFQDTNTIQYAWIRLLSARGAAVMAVGDDDQSIYGWRGAKIANIQRFSKDFQSTQLIRLEQNYRSTATILNAANALISNNQSRMGKTLWTDGSQGEKILLFSAFNEVEEARFVTEQIRNLVNQGRSLDDIAILYRSNAQSRVLEESLLRGGIAYRIYGGMRFFERAEIKDALAYLRLLVNPNDDASFERIVNFPTRGIGEKTLQALRGHARETQSSLWQAAQSILTGNQLTQRAGSALSRFIHLIETLRAKLSDVPLDEQIAHVIHDSGLSVHYTQSKGEKAESKLDNLHEFINAARQFCEEQEEEEEEEETLPILSAFLAHASLEAGEMQADPFESSVHLMTLHAAKGLEYPFVFLVGLEEGLFPRKQSDETTDRLEEERRLCYVGMTRAMEQLIISYAEIRRQYGREEYHRPSRFLHEIPKAYLDPIRPLSPPRPQARTTASTQPFNESGLCLGQTVDHPKFGQGILLSIEGGGAHTRVQVKFSEHGSKWLTLAYANLTVQ